MAALSMAAGAGRRWGLPNSDTVTLRRAGLLHDIGRWEISAGIWTGVVRRTDEAPQAKGRWGTGLSQTGHGPWG